MTSHTKASQEICMSYVYMGLWISLSSSVIIFNKYVLTSGGFPYPITLTMIHMAFCTVMSTALIQTGIVEDAGMSPRRYVKSILPVGALFACVLWLGNAAYLYLSVSFIQMLKASMPVAVFAVGVSLRTETYSHLTAFNMLIVGTGIAIASYGELNFVLVGVLLQGGSILCESLRITLVQMLLQANDIKLNPVTTMYYMSPCCFVFLSVPFTLLEGPLLFRDATLVVDLPVLLSNACCAFALNLAVFLLIGRTSALTMNIAGVVKDWLLIGLSVLIFGSAVSAVNLIGYSIAFGGVWWYNRRRIAALQAGPNTGRQAEQKGPPPVQEAEECRQSLLSSEVVQRGSSSVSQSNKM